jgi:hypothetical protein
VAWKDSVLFSIVGGESPVLTKINSFGAVLWNTPIEQDSCRLIIGFLMHFLVPDGVGGCYLMCVDEDSVRRVNSAGIVSRPVFPGITELGGYAYGDNVGGLVVASDDGLAQRYDSLGNPLWGESPIVYQSDPENSAFEDYWGDNNGGIITTFYAISQGLSAQHTGRYGQPGIILASVPDDEVLIPQVVTLSQNYPNPFNPVTTIHYSIPSRTLVRLKVIDVLGRELETLVDEAREAGRHSATWDAAGVASGVYFYRLELDGRVVQTRKMILVH